MNADIEAEKKAIQDELRRAILEQESLGNVVILTIEGPMTMPIESMIAQPAEGILYDLNRDKVTVLTSIAERKWINDYAVALVITALRKKIDELTAIIEGDAPQGATSTDGEQEK